MRLILLVGLMACSGTNETSSEQGDDVRCACGEEAPAPDLCIEYARDEAVYLDDDDDGYGDPDMETFDCSSVGVVANSDDCDDADDGVSPDAVELCDDDLDNDCDGDVDGRDVDCQD